MGDIARELQLNPDFVAHLTSAVQFGFIIGTLLFAFFSIADRFAPSSVFFISAVLAGLFNLGICLPAIQPSQVLLFRFFTGFFLAGIYPVGMKIAADYYQQGLGKSLGFLVGALVVGTAFPHLLRNFVQELPWKYVLYATTLLSFIGGLCIRLFVPDGPHRHKGSKVSFGAFVQGFRNPTFRSVAFGYFGHMWELYAFWAFVPVMLSTYKNHFPISTLNVPLASFGIIASGGISCVLAGYLSQLFGAKKVATLSLLLSCICCMVSPLFLLAASEISLLIFLTIWGLVVIADSPLFSTLVAQHAPSASKGAALTIVNCIGFSITIISIQSIHFLSEKIAAEYVYMMLAIGPVLGLMALVKKTKPGVAIPSSYTG
jgi:MFS family permease